MDIQKMNDVRYSCTSLVGSNKKGLLKPMANGYYRLPIGAIGCKNSAGFFYTFEGCRKMFEGSHSFMRRVHGGKLRGEVGHPSPQAGETPAAFADRIMKIDERNTCVQFKDIFLNHKDYKDEKGNPLIVIEGDLIPSGVHGPALQKALDNPHENVCFSVRSFTEDYFVRGVRHRDFKYIVTFDWVNEPGISIAEKYKSSGLESYALNSHVESVFTQGQLERACDRQVVSLGMETATFNRQELFAAFGWEQHSAPKFLQM